jgi:hypothetical protein
MDVELARRGTRQVTASMADGARLGVGDRGSSRELSQRNRGSRARCQGDGRRVAELEHHGAQGTWQGRGCGWERAQGAAMGERKGELGATAGRTGKTGELEIEHRKISGRAGSLDAGREERAE